MDRTHNLETSFHTLQEI